MKSAPETEINSIPIKVCIVGGGNAAQAMAALFPHQGIPCNMFVPYGDEAERIQRAIDDQGFIVAEFASHNEPSGEVRGKPDKISQNAADVVPDCNVLILPLPSFAYRDVISQIKPYLQKGTYIGATPGQGGFDWLAKEVLGDVAEDIVLFSILPMPFNCRIIEFGKRVYVQEFKRRYKIGATPAEHCDGAVTINNQLFGYSESCGNSLSCSLYPINAVIHPARLYALCKDWQPGTFLAENPLFYEDINDESAELMDAVSKEVIDIAQALTDAGIEGVSVPHIQDFLVHYVYRDPSPTLKDFFATNRAYKGFRCPFLENKNGWIPDFANRYFTEDIPLGLCLYKGVAEIVGVETPVICKILNWAQAHMGKEYLVDGHLTGRDVNETACPQRFGITTVEQLKTLSEV
ncbi:MAG: NAD/NADP octopine/nopaline dehydrogenase family protein [Desulfuromonadales bacterium]|nr:NAD/NADP octopine/nopaline dehydrogenase family protein [Desulfuromonadales bacterium]